ncbi:hypothetical protein IQ215_04190 [Cyanobacterium stanieri LEGE 03274]|uniref:Molecular chaperone DnaJ n=1 Tax=Cyanobacterium stanieri LEGE 03274 TaxID=1828756 RepID=A0ABR9V1X6_9CHRO|nr:hypothetical protein [Cyanobacterium stanieri]MBE9221890.1 hypothetical protein [Cyanobacterium stanieri LEGE 03274]
MRFCLKCKGSGKVLERRLSDYINSFDYYPIACPDCEGQGIKSQKSAPRN